MSENFQLVESYDFGQTWTEPKLTNIADGLFCPSPWIFYDIEYNHVWIIAIDRRGNFIHHYTHYSSRIWLYKLYPDEILGNPTEYVPFLTILRPKSSFYRIYGYPSTTKTPDGNYLVIFTESEYRSKAEWAYLFQFKIIYRQNPPLDVDYETMPLSLTLFPNPATDEVQLVGKLFSPNKKVQIVIVDELGRAIAEKSIHTTDGFIYEKINVSEFSSGIYRCIIYDDKEVKTRNFIKR